MKFFGKTLAQLGRVPILGVLFRIPFGATKEAGYELLTTTVFSTFPIWFYGLLFALQEQIWPQAAGTHSSFLLTLFLRSREQISNGELFMYVTGLLGPTLYIALNALVHPNKSPPFQWVKTHFFITVLINLVAAILFFMIRSRPGFSVDAIITISFTLYAASVVLLFPVMAYSNHLRVNPTDESRRSADEFIAGYSAHRS